MPKEIDNYSLEKFFQFYCSFISDLIEGKKFLLKPQVKYIGRYNPRLSTLDNGFIDWKWEPLDLLNFINSFDEPYQGSMTYINRGNFDRPFKICSIAWRRFFKSPLYGWTSLKT